MANNCFVDITLTKPQVKPEVIIHPNDGTTPSILFDDFGIFDVQLEEYPKQNEIVILGWVKWTLRPNDFKVVIDRYKPKTAFATQEELDNAVYGHYKYTGKDFVERFLTFEEIEKVNEQFNNKQVESYSEALDRSLMLKSYKPMEDTK